MHCMDYLRAVDAVFTAQLHIEEQKPAFKPAENCEIQREPYDGYNFYPLPQLRKPVYWESATVLESWTDEDRRHWARIEIDLP